MWWRIGYVHKQSHPEWGGRANGDRPRALRAFYDASWFSYTYFMCYPRQLYPTEDSVPCRSVEVPIWPDLRG